MDIRSLGDDMLFYIMDCLSQEDCICMALADEKFFDLFTRRIHYKRSFNFERCYMLTADMFTELTNQLPLEQIRRFDVAGCTSLPSYALLTSIRQMKHLEELCVTDTAIELEDFWSIFPRCPKITKLSFSVHETYCFKPEFEEVMDKLWNDEDAEPVRRGFSRIQSLTVASHTMPNTLWAIVFRILKWCVSCVDLHITWNLTLGDYRAAMHKVKNKYFDMAMSVVDQSPWMKYLRSLVLVERSYSDDLDECLVEYFLKKLFTLWKPKLQRYCVGLEIPHVDIGASIMSPKKRWNLAAQNDLDFEVDCKSLVESAGLSVEKLLESPNILYCNTDCQNSQVWNTFWRSHPDLRQLHVHFVDGFNFDSQFHLPKVETLGIVANAFGASTDASVIIGGCPNIRQLMLGDGNNSNLLTRAIVEQVIRLRKLKVLKMHLVTFDQHEEVIEGCRGLECLHLWRSLECCDTRDQFAKWIRQLSLPENIRELAIHWDIIYPHVSDNMQFLVSKMHGEMSYCAMLAAARQWTHLRVLILQKSSHATGPFNLLKDRIFQLLTDLKELRYLCLIGEFKEDVARKLKRLVKEKIQETRPYLRFYAGPELYHTYYPYE